MTKNQKSKRPISPMQYNKHGLPYWKTRCEREERNSKADQYFREYAEDPRRDIGNRLYPIIDEE